MRFSSGVPEPVTGVEILLERVAKLLLTSVSSNVFTPSHGTAIGDKTTMTFSNPVQVELAINSAVEAAQETILAEQLELDNVPDEQLLDRLEISQIFKSAQDPTVWHVEILVHTKQNQTFYLTV